jgi:hypothetical protein
VKPDGILHFDGRSGRAHLVPGQAAIPKPTVCAWLRSLKAQAELRQRLNTAREGRGALPIPMHIPPAELLAVIALAFSGLHVSDGVVPSAPPRSGG